MKRFEGLDFFLYIMTNCCEFSFIFVGSLKLKIKVVLGLRHILQSPPAAASRNYYDKKIIFYPKSIYNRRNFFVLFLESKKHSRNEKSQSIFKEECCERIRDQFLVFLCILSRVHIMFSSGHLAREPAEIKLP